MFSNRRRRAGFTLPEVLVTVAIVAVLAAIVVPTVTSQIGKGDDTNIATNVTTLRTGVTAFVSDVRKFPSRLQNIFTVVTAANLDITGAAYGAGPAGRWKGPYQAGSLKDLSPTARTDSLNFSLAFAIDSLIDTSFVAATDNGYIGVILGGVTSNAAALHIDSLIDGGTGATVGNLRWSGSPPTDNRLILLLMGSR